MGDNKKLLEETAKEIKAIISEQTKTLELAFEPTKAMITELVEYCKKRAEIENEYVKAMHRLGDRLTDKNERFATMLRGESGGTEGKSELLSLLKCFETETKQRAQASSGLSDIFTNDLQMSASKYFEAQVVKIARSKELFQAIGEELQKESDESFSKRAEYLKMYLLEQKTHKSLLSAQAKHSKSKKTTATIDEKLEKAESAYSDCIICTDRSRNSYILAHAGTRSCHERLFIQQTSDIFLLCNFKLEDFGKYFLSHLQMGHKNYDDMIHKSRETLDTLSFSDASESDLMITRSSRVFLEGSIKMPFILHSTDQTISLMTSGPIKKELTTQCEEIKNQIMTQLAELTEMIIIVEDLKDKSIFVSNVPPAVPESGKEAPPRGSNIRRVPSVGISDILSKYLDNAKSYMMKDTRLHHLKTIHNRMLQCLESPFVNQKTRIAKKSADLRNIMAFGANLSDHCRELDVKIPAPITLCVQYLHDNEYLKTKGIFRLSASTQTVNNIKETIITKGKIDAESCALSVANILKQYIRELKGFVDPTTFPLKLSGISMLHDEEFVKETRQVLSDLSVFSRDLIIFMAKFINYVATFGDENKMDYANLSICFGPTLFPAPNTDESSVALQNNVNRFLKDFSAKVYVIYPEEPPLFVIEEVPEHPSPTENRPEGEEEVSPPDPSDLNVPEGIDTPVDSNDNPDRTSEESPSIEDYDDTTSDKGEYTVSESGEASPQSAAINADGSPNPTSIQRNS